MGGGITETICYINPKTLQLRKIQIILSSPHLSTNLNFMCKAYARPFNFRQRKSE